MAAKSDRHIMSQKLEEAEGNIKSSNPAKGGIPEDIQQLSPSNDAGKIEYFPERAPRRRWPPRFPKLRTKKPDSKKGQGNETEDKNWTNLEKAKSNINLSKPAKDDIPKDIQKLSPSKDAGKIKYFPEMKNAVRENFEKFRKDTCLELDLELDLKNSNLTKSGTELGTFWHTILKNYINNSARNESERKAAKAVVDRLKSEFKGIEFLKAEFPLYGYMIDKESSQVSFWDGIADAIGWYENGYENGYKNSYVIVEWKAVDIQNFRKKNRDAHGKYLPQCLVYARLLQLHLELDELPYILIVAINKTGEDIRPALFHDFSKERKDSLEKFKWSKDQPELRGRLKRKVVVDEYKTGKEIEMETLVRDVFAENTTVGALLDALHLDFSKLELVG